MRLNVLETIEEGECVLAQKLKFVRKYLHCTTDSAMYSHYSQIYDSTLAHDQFRGSIGMFHGFAQC